MRTPLFEDGKRHALYPIAVCGARATFPNRPEAEDCEPCMTTLAGLPKVPPEHPDTHVVFEQVYQAWYGTTEPWGGCADKAAIARVMQLFTGKDHTSDL